MDFCPLTVGRHCRIVAATKLLVYDKPSAVTKPNFLKRDASVVIEQICQIAETPALQERATSNGWTKWCLMSEGGFLLLVITVKLFII